MKVVHSFWSKPSFKTKNFFSDDRSKGGWSELKYFYMSWTLSCLKSKEFYDNLELITDNHGKKILIDYLKLPYSNVKVELDKLNFYSEDLWTLGKIYSHTLHNEPFLHIDSDVYIWNSFDESLINASLVAQNIESNINWYFEMLKNINGLIDAPELTTKDKNYSKVLASNTGIVGGKNYDFFKYYAETAFNIIDNNIKAISNLENKALFSVLVEQVLFYQLAKKRGLPIEYYINKPITGNFAELVQFYGIPSKTSFIHAIGSSNKKDIDVLTHLEMRLRIEYPEYYYLILNLMSEHFTCMY